MQHSEGAVVSEVHPASVAERLGIRPGDRVISINGQAVTDLIDLLILTSGRAVTVRWETPQGGTLERTAGKGENEGLGLSFEQAVFDGIRHCQNRCLFCFVDQLPRGMRPTLYIKDDDYRLSFLQGAYVTLSNLREQDWQRIMRFRLSPLYVSVHATDPAIRARLLGLPAPTPVLPHLARLSENGIIVHGQVVACPGINDGPVLDETISDLAGLYPGVASLAVVPVGLTGHRSGLAQIHPYGPEEAAAVIRQIEVWQRKCLDRLGTRFVFASDEWYLLSGRPLPPEDDYEDYPQISNGVGLLRTFVSEFDAEEAGLPASVAIPGRLFLITGKAFRGVLGKAAERLSKVRGLEPQVVPVDNRFFGPRVDVAGLVVGADVLEALRRVGADRGDTVFVPDIMLRSGESRFLDDVTPADLTQATKAEVRVIRATAEGLVQAVRDYKGGEPTCPNQS